MVAAERVLPLDATEFRPPEERVEPLLGARETTGAVGRATGSRDAGQRGLTGGLLRELEGGAASGAMLWLRWEVVLSPTLFIHRGR